MGIALHLLGALAIVLATAWCYWLSILGFAFVGFFFEKTQHRYFWSVVDGKLHRKKTGWFGWVTKHRLLEAAGWPAGAFVACVVWTILRITVLS